MFGNTNAPPAVSQSAIIYALRCMVTRDIPLNHGCMAPITVRIPPGESMPWPAVPSGRAGRGVSRLPSAAAGRGVSRPPAPGQLGMPTGARLEQGGGLPRPGGPLGFILNGNVGTRTR